MASPAVSPYYSQAGYDFDEDTNANKFLSILHSGLIGILTKQSKEVLKPNTLDARVQETDNQLQYYICDGLLLT